MTTENQHTDNPAAANVYISNQRGPLTPSMTRGEFYADLQKITKIVEVQPSHSDEGAGAKDMDERTKLDMDPEDALGTLLKKRSKRGR